ncbi:MAG: sensor histidine kinase [Desulfobacteraceae bacterium]|nr:sensor histidine kinase [Desulfobacteraceae bacterium]MBC2757001.1 sensor histidine kinase [Desulfobacteraceae bacterium]
MEEMDDSTKIIEPVRNNLVNTVLFTIVICGLPCLIAVLVLSYKFGRLESYIPHTVGYIVCLLTILLRNWLSFRMRAGILLGILFVVGTSGMVNFGLIGAGTYFLFVCCMLAAILFGTIFGLLALLVCIANMAIIGLRLHLGKGSFALDIVAYATDPTAWVLRILYFGLFSAIIILSLSRLYRVLLESIEARDRTASQLRRSREAIRNFSTHMQDSIEEERKRIARELHDELGQSLTSLRMELAAMVGRLQSDQGPLSEKSFSMLGLLNRTITSVKRICTELRPSVMDDLGLTAAIEWLAEDFQKRTGIQVEVFTNPPDIFADDKLSIAVFRIAQEALTNVARHAGAKHVKITLEWQDSNLILFVHDDGRGIQQEELDKRGSFGILGAQERVSILGGSLTIQGDQETGTQLHVRLPSKNGEKP